MSLEGNKMRVRVGRSMRRSPVIWCALLLACGSEARVAHVDSAAAVAALRVALVRLGVQDQQGRDSIAMAVARVDTAFLQRIARADSVRTHWLRSHVAAHGWPRRSLVGDTAATAAWLIVQHSADVAFQGQMLPLLEQAAKAGEVGKADVAMLADRVAVHQGRAQRYGTQFSLHDGKLAADSIADVAALDSLRSSVGLPPMREYVSVLEKVNGLPVIWPPRIAPRRGMIR